MSEGIVYITSGDVYLEEAKVSARRVKEVMPDVDVAVIADRPPDSDIFDEYVELSEPNYSWMDKVENLPRSPFEKTIYFDSDIYLEKDVSELFSLLDRYDMALVPDTYQHPVHESHPYHSQAGELYSGVDRVLTEYNAGVIVYQQSRTVRDTFADWRELYDPENHWSDQPSLRVALAQNDVRVHPLRTQYNYVPGLENALVGEVKIVHNRLIDSSELPLLWKDVKPSELEAVIEKVNGKAHRARVTYPSLNYPDRSRVHLFEGPNDLVVHPPMSPLDHLYYGMKSRRLGTALWRFPPISLIKQFYLSSKERGIRTTVKAAARRSRKVLPLPNQTD